MTVGVEIYVFALTSILRTKKIRCQTAHSDGHHMGAQTERWIPLCVCIILLRHAYDEVQTSPYHHLARATVHLLQ